MKAVAEATGRSLQKIKSDVEECGDLGQVTCQSRKNQKTLFKAKALTVKAIFKNLKEIASITGNLVASVY